MRISGICLILILASMTNPLRAQAPGPVWTPDFDQALEAAKAQTKPILICMHKMEEVACDRMINEVYTDPEVQTAMKDFIAIPTSLDRHDGANPGGACSRFPGITCR